MGNIIEVFTFNDGKRMYKDKISYANGKYVLLSDYEKVVDELKRTKHHITQLKHDLDETYNQLMETEKRAQDKIAELESELEVKDNLLEIKNGLLGNNDDSPIDPIEVAQMLINSTYEYEPSDLEKAIYKCRGTRTTEKYQIDDLEQIAEHLLVYCKHNRKDEE